LLNNSLLKIKLQKGNKALSHYYVKGLFVYCPVSFDNEDVSIKEKTKKY